MDMSKTISVNICPHCNGNHDGLHKYTPSSNDVMELHKSLEEGYVICPETLKLIPLSEYYPKQNIMKQENLTKENFWNELQEKYPNGLKIFCNWIDNYKEENHWNLLFKNGDSVPNADNLEYKNIKFHDIPLAMQIGIWLEFLSSTYINVLGIYRIENVSLHDWKKGITDVIVALHRTHEV